ncbi:MAG: hypothetical protein JWO08_251 [Verrucomicrobiaceae bacterium]|nr:hypothetical protein [Verrucomicrobiaceae bacterium]
MAEIPWLQGLQVSRHAGLTRCRADGTGYFLALWPASVQQEDLILQQSDVLGTEQQSSFFAVAQEARAVRQVAARISLSVFIVGWGRAVDGAS